MAKTRKRMARRSILVMWLLAASLLLNDSISAKAQKGQLQPAVAEQQAQASDSAWLSLADAGKYDASWDAASAYFKAEVPKDKWIGALGRVRGPLGTVQSRVLQTSRIKTSLPGAPDGQYVITQYATTFENAKSGIETLICMREKDGVWRVAGYFIR